MEFFWRILIFINCFYSGEYDESCLIPKSQKTLAGIDFEALDALVEEI